MKIRYKLALGFALVSFVLLLSAAAIVYFVQQSDRQQQLLDRLQTKARKAIVYYESNQLNSIQQELDDAIGVLPEERLLIYDIDRRLLYQSDSGNVNLTGSILSQVNSRKPAKFSDNELEGFGFQVKGSKQVYLVLASANDIFGRKKLENLANVLSLVVFGGFLLSFACGLAFASRAMNPISEVIKQVDAIDYSNISARVASRKGRDEIALLAYTFNKMLDRLEVAFKVQRNFVANASHEMRTPLTAITGQLEVVLLKERTNREYKMALESVLDDIINLTQTSNRLLLLAQTDSKIAESSFQPLRIDDILWQAQAEVIKRKPDYKIDITFYDLPEDEMQLTILGNDQLLITMATNLMDNGCKFSPDHTVKVQLSVYKSLVQIMFSDQGSGIPKEDLPHIFEPFYRSKNAILVKGHGIGLSLVQRIVNIHHGNLKVLSEPGVGTAFILTFPLNL
ncbi:MAG: ATP-binding protein [Chitinophagales bacterium]|nr:ATP-binding protein [Chitinophagales bacterium]